MNHDDRGEQNVKAGRQLLWPVPSALLGCTGVGTTAVAVAHAPWWAIMICTLTSLACAGLNLAWVVLSAVFPQDSADRLAWWKDRRRHRERVRAEKAAAVADAKPGPGRQMITRSQSELR